MKKVRRASRLERRGVTMKNEDMQNYCPFENIASDVIMKIFSFLPTKACLKCKLVCKAWYDIITNREFANQRRAHGCYRSLLLQGRFSGSRKEFVLLDLDRSSKVVEEGNITVGYLATLTIKPNFGIPVGKLHLINECNGLICLKVSAHWSPFIICNLLTGQQWTVKQTYKPNAFIYSCGLGHFLRSDDSGQFKDYFKVLRILVSRKERCYVAEIQTLGTNEWRSVGKVPKVELGKAFLHGSLHGYSNEDNCIWSFDCGEEKFSPVPLSDELKRKKVTGVSTLDSFLCCKTTTSGKEDLCEIWIMKEYGNKDSWVKQFSFSLVKHSSDDGMPFLRMDSGEVMFRNPVVGCNYRSFLIVRDLESKTHMCVRFISDNPSEYCTSFGKYILNS